VPTPEAQQQGQHRLSRSQGCLYIARLQLTAALDSLGAPAMLGEVRRPTDITFCAVTRMPTKHALSLPDSQLLCKALACSYPAGALQYVPQHPHSVRQEHSLSRAAVRKGEDALPERYVPQPANEGGSQAIAIPGLGGEMDTEILSLLVPATLAVFLDPAMALIDTGKCSGKRCLDASTLLVKLIYACEGHLEAWV